MPGKAPSIMDILSQDMRPIARAINRFLDAPGFDIALTTALLSVVEAIDLTPSGDEHAPLVAWPREDGGREALAIAGRKLVHAIAEPDAQVAMVTAYPLANVESMAALDLTHARQIGSEFEWDIGQWVITITGGNTINIAGLRGPSTLDIVTRFLRALLA